jgi:hypothetical protein
LILVLRAVDTMRTSIAIAVAVVLVASSAHAQGPAVRIDFEGRLAKPAAPAPYTPGPPVRIDFEGRQARPAAAGAPYTAGSPVRIDFEGHQPKPDRVVATPSMPSSPPPSQSPPKGQSPSASPQKQVARAAAIKSVQPEKCVPKGGSLTILGAGFGAIQGGARMMLAAASVPLKVASWSDERVVAVLPDDPRIEAGKAYGLGLQESNGQSVSNTMKIVICVSKG